MTIPLNTTTHSTDDIDILVRQQAQILRDLAALAVRQHDAVDRADDDALDEVLGRRQPLVDRLRLVSAAVSELSAQIHEVISHPGPRAERLAADLADASRLWSELAAHDSRDLDRLRAQRDRLRSELNDLDRAGRAGRAYAGPRDLSQPIFQDRHA